MFSFEIGFFAFLVAGFGYQMKFYIPWISEALNIKFFKIIIMIGFFCSVYLFAAGLNLFATDYLNNFTSPALDKINSNPEMLKAVHSPKRGIALILILVAPWALVIFGVMWSFIYFKTWKEIKVLEAYPENFHDYFSKDKKEEK